MPQVVAYVAGQAAMSWAAAAGYGAVATALIGAGASYIAGEISGSLMGSNEAVDTAQGALVNKASNNAPIPIIYGYRKVGGTRVYMEVSGDENEYLHMVLVLGEGKVNNITGVYLNGVNVNDSRFDGHVTVIKKRGYTNQTPITSAEISNLPPNWTSNHCLHGVAYLYVRLKWNQDVFPQGLPTITTEVDGKLVHDPRLGYDNSSRNPALAVRDYLTNTIYGRSIPESQLDDDSFIAAANYCDQMVTKGGASAKRYETNGIADISQTSLTILNNLLTSCRGMLVFTGGKYRLLINKPEAPVFTFSEDNITGNWAIVLGNKSNVFNRVTAIYYNPSNNWQQDQAIVDSPEWRAKDNAIVLESQVALPFTTDQYTAKQIATINLKQSRQHLAVEFTATIEGLQVDVGDVVYIKHATPGWDSPQINNGQGMLFRIMGLRLQSDDLVKVTCQEYADDVYDFGTIEAVDPTPNTALPDPTVAGAPTITDVTESLYTTTTSKGAQVRLNVTWAKPSDAFVSYYELEYKESGDSDWIYHARTYATTARIDDLFAGTFDVRVRMINTISKASDWAAFYNKPILGLTAPPADVDNFSVRAIDGSCHLSWVRSRDVDVIHGGYVRVRHSTLISGATWDDGQDIGQAMPGTTTNVTLPLLAGTYMARFVDSSENYSVNTSTAITTVPNILNFNNVVEYDEHENGFPGTRHNMIIDTQGNLKLDGVPWFIKLEDGGNILLEDGRDLAKEVSNANVVESYGTYDFGDTLDLGSVFTSRVSAVIKSSSASTPDVIDSRTTLIDSWGNFDGQASEDINVSLLIATTLDDPDSGSAEWSEWSTLLVGDYQARGFKFRVEVTNDDSTYNVSITELIVNIDMPDRTERGINSAVAAGGTTFTYKAKFADVPAVGVTMQNGESGDYFTVDPNDSTRSDFIVRCYNSSGTPIQRTINWAASGYGKEAA